MKEGEIITDPWIISRARLLDRVSRQLRKGQHLMASQRVIPATDIFVDVEGKTIKHPVDHQTLFGIWTVRESIKKDLVDVGEKELAEQVIFQADHRRSR